MSAGVVAFIGLGAMGAPMAASLARAGFEMRVYNRTRSVADAWAAAHGGMAAATAREAAAGAGAVVTIVVDGPQVESVLLGPDGAAASAPPGTLFVDMSTIGPGAARRIGAALAERGHRFVDAPVTGSVPRAQDGTLTIMAGGADADVDAAAPLFAAMGETTVRAGALGQGQAFKVLSNAVTAINTLTIAQVLAVGRAAGLDIEAFVQVMRTGSAASAMLESKARPFLDHAFVPPRFKLDHMLKDVRLALDEAHDAGAGFPSAALAGEFYASAMGRGLGQQDFAAVLEVVEGLLGPRP